jgi:hypothetical protein
MLRWETRLYDPSGARMMKRFSIETAMRLCDRIFKKAAQEHPDNTLFANLSEESPQPDPETPTEQS